MPNLLSLLRRNRHCRALFTTVLVCLDHDSSLVMWTPRNLNLKLSTCSTAALSMRMGSSYSCSSQSFPLSWSRWGRGCCPGTTPPGLWPPPYREGYFIYECFRSVFEINWHSLPWHFEVYFKLQNPYAPLHFVYQGWLAFSSHLYAQSLVHFYLQSHFGFITFLFVHFYCSEMWWLLSSFAWLYPANCSKFLNWIW